MKFKNLYTGKGDRGFTSLWGGGYVLKTDPRIQTVGLIDEFCAAFGVAYAHTSKSDIYQQLHNVIINASIQLMGEIVSTKLMYKEEYLQELKNLYDILAKNLDETMEIKDWAKYGTVSICCSFFDWAGTVARKAEIAVHELKSSGYHITSEWYTYLNLLSKVLFLCGRKEF